MGSMRAHLYNRRVPLMRAQFDAIVGGDVGRSVSQKLASDETDFNRRLLSGYQYAGAACVDSHPERSFLMLAIALESVILGRDTNSELSHQLGNRVAHLIGSGLNGRKLVAKTINELYRRRSKIVHTGEYGVSRTDAALMWFYCITALNMLVVAPAFSSFKTSAELEEWFRDRVLDGPNHM
jgi:hypothetical protein